MSAHVCASSITFEDSDGVRVHITCQRQLSTALGHPVGHHQHYRDLDVPGCEHDRVSWTRRPGQLDEATLMSGNGAFAKANAILSVEEALVETARFNRVAIGTKFTQEAWEAARVAWSLAAYVDALVKVRGT